MPVPRGAGIKRTETDPHLPVTCEKGKYFNLCSGTISIKLLLRDFQTTYGRHYIIPV